MTISIRPIQESDAAAFLELCQALDRETTFMMLEPGERATTPGEQAAEIRRLLARDNQMIFVAEQDGRLLGYIGGYGGDFQRSRHCVYIVIGLLQSAAGQGLGALLFAALEDWARANQLRRLELSVMVHNQRAVRLYQKMGFSIEGTRRDSLRVDGKFLDEYAMAKLLD